MDKNIPTVELKVKNGDKDVTVVLYQWLTESEEEQGQSIIYKDIVLHKELDMSKSEKERNEDLKKGTQSMDISYANMSEQSNYYLKCLLKSPLYEEFEIMTPDARKIIKAKIKEILDGNEKK